MRTGLGPENRNGGKTPPASLQHLSFVGIMMELSLTFLSSYGDRNYKVCLCWSFPDVPQLCRAFPILSPHWALWPALQGSFPISPCSESLFTECWEAFFSPWHQSDPSTSREEAQGGEGLPGTAHHFSPWFTFFWAPQCLWQKITVIKC